jgi:hypothetical protein
MDLYLLARLAKTGLMHTPRRKARLIRGNLSMYPSSILGPATYVGSSSYLK